MRVEARRLHQTQVSDPIGGVAHLAGALERDILGSFNWDVLKDATDGSHEATTHGLCGSQVRQVGASDRVLHDKRIEELVGVRRAHEDTRRAIGRHLEAHQSTHMLKSSGVRGAAREPHTLNRLRAEISRKKMSRIM